MTFYWNGYLYLCEIWRKEWRYQRDSKNKTIIWQKKRKKKDIKWSTKLCTRTLKKDSATRIPLKTGRKPRCSGKVISRGVMIHFSHKRYVARYLICITICITIHFIWNCNYSLKSMLVDVGTAMFFLIWGRLRTSGNYKYLIFD